MVAGTSVADCPSWGAVTAWLSVTISPEVAFRSSILDVAQRNKERLQAWSVQAVRLRRKGDTLSNRSVLQGRVRKRTKQNATTRGLG